MQHDNEETPTFLLFGEDKFCEETEKALLEGSLKLERFYKRNENKMVFKPQGSDNHFGSVYLTDYGNTAVFMGFQAEKVHDHKNPWDYKSLPESLIFDIEPSKQPLQNFESFVNFMIMVEANIREKCLEVYQKQVQDSIPQAFLGILEFDLFRGICECATKIEFNIATPTVVGGKEGLIAMLQVCETDFDSVFFSDFVGVK